MKKGPKLHRHSPVHWQQCQRDLTSNLGSLSACTSRWLVQSVLTKEWQGLMSHLKQHLVACHDFENGGTPHGGHLGKRYLRWAPKPSAHVSARGTQDHTSHLLTKQVHRLISLAHVDITHPKHSQLTDKLRREESVVCSKLKLSSVEVVDALVRPLTWIQDWSDRLDRYNSNLRQSSIRDWRKTLTVEGKPSAKLYRWLKGLPPRPPMVVWHDGKLHKGPQEFFPVVISVRGSWGSFTPHMRIITL
eukprot:149047-Amphidinium_carterae.3